MHHDAFVPERCGTQRAMHTCCVIDLLIQVSHKLGSIDSVRNAVISGKVAIPCSESQQSVKVTSQCANLDSSCCVLQLTICLPACLTAVSQGEADLSSISPGEHQRVGVSIGNSSPVTACKCTVLSTGSLLSVLLQKSTGCCCAGTLQPTPPPVQTLRHGRPSKQTLVHAYSAYSQVSTNG